MKNDFDSAWDLIYHPQDGKAISDIARACFEAGARMAFGVPASTDPDEMADATLNPEYRADRARRRCLAVEIPE